MNRFSAGTSHLRGGPPGARQQGAPTRMPTRITVRYLGWELGKKVALPDTKKELLELA